VWQEVRAELHPQGLEVVTVALDTGGAEAAGPWIEAAQPEHPSLIDEAHLLDELLGIVNVPSGVWIDEQGIIVRPPEPAFPGRAVLSEMEFPDDLPPQLAEMLDESSKIRIEPERYLAALRDWAANGADSKFVLGPDEVLERSARRPIEVSQAAACFELGQHLHRSGHPQEAVRWFREAHRLQPDNWTYKRQAWSFVDPLQGPSEEYEGDWLSDVRKIGAENYYPPVEL
jgi:Tetratricopeptide repeat